MLKYKIFVLYFGRVLTCSNVEGVNAKEVFTPLGLSGDAGVVDSESVLHLLIQLCNSAQSLLQVFQTRLPCHQGILCCRHCGSWYQEEKTEVIRM